MLGIKEPRSLVIHPYNIAIYPVIALLAVNLGEAYLKAAIRPLLVSLMGAILLVLLLRLVIKDKSSAGILTTFFLALFYSYGHIYTILKPIELWGIPIGRHRYLAFLWLIILVIGSWSIIKKLKGRRQVTAFLNLATCIAMIFPLAQIVRFEARSYSIAVSQNVGDSIILDESIRLPQDQLPPDIYYIILDGYSRDDTLRQVFNYDNSPFLESLEDKGFFVAHCSQANYAQTELSLSASLNFNYLDQLGDTFFEGNDDRSALWPLILHSAVRRYLEDFGYSVVAFETGFNWTQMKDADQYLTPAFRPLQEMGLVSGLSGFETLLIRSSAFFILTDAAEVLPGFLVPNLDQHVMTHRARVLFVLGRLEHLPSSPGPKFVFVHIVSPHSPLVFAPDGELLDRSYWADIAPGEMIADQDRYNTGYIYQIQYLNSRMEDIVNTIIEDSATPPIIIIQGDHGSEKASHRNRMNILNVYYLPDGGEAMLYDSISPVNSFRVIFSYYFGADFPILDDISYYSTYADPYSLQVIPNECNESTE